MKKTVMLITVMLILVILMSGCTQQIQETTDIKQQAIDLCIQICKNNPVGTTLEEAYKNGPCLSDDEPNWKIDDWVCDIAHSPRKDIDNLPENQCSAYRERKAHHFVELDTSCNLIRAV